MIEDAASHVGEKKPSEKKRKGTLNKIKRFIILILKSIIYHLLFFGHRPATKVLITVSILS